MQGNEGAGPSDPGRRISNEGAPPADPERRAGGGPPRRIIAALVALVLLAVLIPLACQALRGGDGLGSLRRLDRLGRRDPRGSLRRRHLPGRGDLRAFVVEVLITSVLVFVVVSVVTDDTVPAAVAPLAIGFALACGVFIAGPVTGGAVNPARASGPPIVACQSTVLRVYLLAPVAGGVLAALLHDRFMSEAEALG